VSVSSPAPNPKLLLILISPRRRVGESEAEQRLYGDPASVHVVVALLWLCSPACVPMEERATVKPFHSGALRFLRDGQTPASGDNDVEFLPETGVDGDDGSGLG
jgi:hypothetical protein